MAKQNLSTVTNELIASYGNTAKNVITACRVGNKRAVSYVDQSWATAVKKTAPRLNADVRGNAIATQKKLPPTTSKAWKLPPLTLIWRLTKPLNCLAKVW